MVLETNVLFYLEESNANVDYQGYIFPMRHVELVSTIPIYLWYTYVICHEPIRLVLKPVDKLAEAVLL